MIKNYFKVAFRNFWRHKLFTFINVIGLSIGISASLVIFLIVQHDLTFDKFHKDGDRIYRVVTNYTFSGEPGYNPGVCGPLPWAARNQLTGSENITPIFKLLLPDVYIPNNKTVASRFKAQSNVTLVDKSYFDLISYQWLSGSAATALNDPYHVVLTSDQAKLYFPHLSFDQMVGKTVIYDTIRTTVSGIVEPLKENTGFTSHDFISYPTAFANNDLKAGLRLHNWGGTNVTYQLFVKLYPNTKASQIERQLNDILKKNYTPSKGKTQAFALQPLSDIHFNTRYGGIANYDETANRTTLYSLLGIALFLLLLGCINFINLTTAQATQRAKEIGIRKTMGSSRTQIITQFLYETFLITLVAVMLSALLVPFILRLFSEFIPTGVKYDLFHQPGILVFLLILSALVSFLSGFYPAIILSGYKPVSALKNQVHGGMSTRNVWMRKSLTVTQFVIAQFFIMATLLVSKQIYYALHKDLGFKKDAVITVASPWKTRQKSLNNIFLNKLRTMPEIEMVSLGHDEPSSENTSSTEGTYKNGKKELKIEDLAEKFGDENYIKLYHIKLLAGRNLLPNDSLKEFLINNTLAKLMGFKDPHEAIGRQIDDFNGNTKMRIVGVVSDFHQASLHASIAPLVIFTSADKDFSGTFHIALKPQTANGDEWKTAIAAMEKEWKQVYPADDFEYHFVDENIAKLYAGEQHTAELLNWATGLSILISCLGLLGLAIYTANQRTKEIGVRKVLGASVSQIVVLLSSEMLWLIILAFLIVTPAAWYAMNKWMQGFADRTAISWWIFAISGVGMLLTALFTSGFQTIKAALANPVKSLRSE